jgi:hypothetical protein
MKDNLELGLFENMTYDDYNAINAIRSTDVKAASRSMRYWQRSKQQKDETEALSFGRLLHLMMNDEDTALDNVLAPLINERTGEAYGFDTKAQKEHRSKVEKEGKVIMPEPDIKMMKEMVKSAKSHPLFGSCITDDEDCKQEIVVVWEEQGVPCKAMIDVINPFALVDWKSIHPEMCTSFGIDLAVRKFRYDIQMTFYNRGLRYHGMEREHLILAFMEKHEVAPDFVMREIGLQEKAEAEETINFLLPQMAECLRTGYYSGLSDNEILLPWKELEAEGAL